MKKSTFWLLLLITLITLLGGFLRFYKIAQNPPSLNGDEIAFGYSAYSILKTGNDEYGKHLPLVFKSLGDYKNPLPVYLMVPAIKLFGLTEFAVRFPNALFGTLSIPVFFFFILDIFKKKKIAFIGSFLLAISAWHIFYSRFAYENVIASLFVLLGIWGFIKLLKGSIYWAIPSAFFFTLTMYTAFAPRLFVPIFIFGAIVINFRQIKSNWPKVLLFAGSCVILGLPLLYVTLFQGAGTRFQSVFIGNDIEFSRNVILKYWNSISDLPLLFFFWVNRYISYLDPRFIFFNGLEATIPSPIGLGMLYVFEIPLFIAGIVALIKNPIPNKPILMVWALAGILPDSLTTNQQHTGRLIHLFPILIIIVTFGIIELYNLVRRMGKLWLRVSIVSIFAIFIVLNLTHAYLVISTDFPIAKGESFDEGWKEAIKYVGLHQNEYSEIVMDPVRGIDQPNIVSNPFLYVLFYLKYDPFTYQTEQKITSIASGGSYYKFNKYVFRNIYWPNDKKVSGTLYIGSPWSLPTKDLKEGELLKTIYLTNGSPAFYIVSPK